MAIFKEDPVERAKLWDRCYPGNLNIELLVDDLEGELVKSRETIAKLISQQCQHDALEVVPGEGYGAPSHARCVKCGVIDPVSVGPAPKPRESTGFADSTGREIFAGDLVRSPTEEAFNEIHGAWVEREVAKVAGGYALMYVRSKKGCVMPYGYTACFMKDFHDDHKDAPSEYVMLWASAPVVHPFLTLVSDGLTHEERIELYETTQAKRDVEREGKIL